MNERWLVRGVVISVGAAIAVVGVGACHLFGTLCSVDDDCGVDERCVDGLCSRTLAPDGEGEGEAAGEGEGEGEGGVEGGVEGEGEGEGTGSFRFVLTWDSADGDLDLYLARRADLCTTDSCFYGRRSVDWSCDGVGGDPSLDIDDLSGFGPEQISIRDPAVDPLFVGVHSYAADGSVRNATLKGFVDGRELFSVTRALGQHDLWPACRIDVAARTALCDTNALQTGVTTCGQTAPEAPLCGTGEGEGEGE